MSDHGFTPDLDTLRAAYRYLTGRPYAECDAEFDRAIAKLQADELRAAAAEWAAPLSKQDRTPRTGAHVDQWLRDLADNIEEGQS